jgi:membrane-bound ClpP family serine protease
MIGAKGVVKAALAPAGQVMVDGELWQAVSDEGPLPEGERVEVRSMDGLTLRVTRASQRA